MPRLLLMVLFLCLNTPGVLAQKTGCGTSTPYFSPRQNARLDPVDPVEEIRSVDRTGNNEKMYFKLKFYSVVSTDSVASIQEESIHNMIDHLNKAFWGADIQFEAARRHKRIISAAWGGFEREEDETALLTEFRDPKLINVYCVENIWSVVDAGQEEQLAGYTYHPDDKARAPHQENIIILTIQTAETEMSNVIHEFGHFFGLYHTHEGAGTAKAEWVTRRNCDRLGDGLCDTPADPGLTGLVHANDPRNCYFDHDEMEDALGEPYEPMVENFMSYSPHICRNKFTIGQLNRMKEYAVFQRSNLSHERRVNAPGVSGRSGRSISTQIVYSLPEAQQKAEWEGAWGAFILVYHEDYQWSIRQRDELFSPEFKPYFTGRKANLCLLACSLREIGSHAGVIDFLGNNVFVPSDFTNPTYHALWQSLYPEIAPAPGVYLVKFSKNFQQVNELVFSYPGYMKPREIKALLDAVPSKRHYSSADD